MLKTSFGSPVKHQYLSYVSLETNYRYRYWDHNCYLKFVFYRYIIANAVLSGILIIENITIRSAWEVMRIK